MMFPKNKGKKKKGHITNKKPHSLCELCRHQATEWHELRGGPYRNISINYGFQMDLCSECHRFWHEKMSKEDKKIYQAKKQRKIMISNGWDIEDWLLEFDKSYL